MIKTVIKLVLLILATVGIYLAGCSPTLRWIPESSSPTPACQPNRLLTWDDFSVKALPSSTPAAQTAIRFLLNHSPPYFIAKFDPAYSWVKPQSANPVSPTAWIASQKLLAHEQVHFLISCLLVRQANHTIEIGDNLQQMLELLKSVAQRINVQYDSDTKHGTDEQAQMRWESEVQQQFEEVSNTHGDM